MKIKVFILSLLMTTLIACRPSRETTKFVIETQLLDKETNVYQNFDLIYTKYDRRNRSYLELATIKTNDGTKYIFSSDVISNKISVKYNLVNYFMLNSNEIFSIIKKLEKMYQIDNDFSKNNLIYRAYKINSDVIFVLTGYYNPKFSDDKFNNFEYQDIEIWIGKRCHKIPYAKFKMLLEI